MNEEEVYAKDHRAEGLKALKEINRQRWGCDVCKTWCRVPGHTNWMPPPRLRVNVKYTRLGLLWRFFHTIKLWLSTPPFLQEGVPSMSVKDDVVAAQLQAIQDGEKTVVIGALGASFDAGEAQGSGPGFTQADIDKAVSDAKAADAIQEAADLKIANDALDAAKAEVAKDEVDLAAVGAKLDQVKAILNA